MSPCSYSLYVLCCLQSPNLPSLHGIEIMLRCASMYGKCRLLGYIDKNSSYDVTDHRGENVIWGCHLSSETTFSIHWSVLRVTNLITQSRYFFIYMFFQYSAISWPFADSVGWFPGDLYSVPVPVQCTCTCTVYKLIKLTNFPL